MGRAITLYGPFNPGPILNLLLSSRDDDIVWTGSILVNTRSKRYKLFDANPSCVECGRSISYALLQTTDAKKFPRRAHFNFFSEDGTLMTKDHIIPKSKKDLFKGRSINGMSNLQTMCAKCNSRKGDNV